jgi:AraC-like DNA-binding protein
MEQHSIIYKAAVAIRDAIIANPFHKTSAKELTLELHIDRRELLPAFKELTGTTIRRFHFEKLMKAAGEMLLSGMTVKQVAIKCGYQHYLNNFTRGFRKYYKAAPEEWVQSELKKLSNKHMSSKKVHS